MKKLLFFTIILLLTGVLYGQTVRSKKNLEIYKPAPTLFLDDASHIGGIINFGNGDVTITHTSANLLNFAGGVVNFSVLPTIAGASLSALYTSGNISIGANSLLMTGSIGATGARVTKGWFADLEITNLPSINGTAITTTAAKLNYLTSATGTTGTASTNIVFSTSPTLVTPAITTSITIDAAGDTTVTAAKGKIVYKSSDNHFYGCISTTATSTPKWKRLDN
jgi:hypothetical protein